MVGGCGAAGGHFGREVVKTVAGKDRKLRSHLLQCLPDDLLMHVATKEWKRSLGLFEGKVRGSSSSAGCTVANLEE